MSADPLSVAAERDRVLAVYDGNMAEGAEWMVIPADWLQQWASYVGINLLTRRPEAPTRTLPPPPIDQSALRDPAYPAVEVLRPALVEGTDYECVPSAVADILFSLYAQPGTPRFARTVVAVGVNHHARVDLYPAFLTLVPLTEDGVEKEEERRVAQFHTSSTWNKVRDQLLQQEHAKAVSAAAKREEEKEEEKEEVSSSTQRSTHSALCVQR